MSVTRKQFMLGMILAAAVCAAVYAFGVRQVSRPAPDLVKAETSENKIVPTFWARTSDFETAASRSGSEAPLFEPPTIYPLLAEDADQLDAVDPLTAKLPGGARPTFEISVPSGDSDGSE